jgi:methionyl-tRNA synthetase
LWKGLYCVSCEENISESASHKDEHGVLRCEHGHELVSKEEESYFFKMSKFQD